jgi:D-serine dehydratase
MKVLDLPIIDSLRNKIPLLWLNPILGKVGSVLPSLHSEHGIGMDDIRHADALLRRWSKALIELFPELGESHGLIESPLIQMAHYSRVMGYEVPGQVWIKADHGLPVAGSIKARGGIYEVLCFAEKLGRDQGLLVEEDCTDLLSPHARSLFGKYTVAVGSTGNLGLSIGIMASALGFRSIVHMSRDAKEWKKARLRKRGVEVVEHDGDYAAAVAAGRAEAAQAQNVYFVDDENSRNLFLGYAVAALRLKEQLANIGIAVDAYHPLFVYLPCGVGGAPGGITFGLKHVLGDLVHCFFAEPCASPAMLVRMISGAEPHSVYDIGLDNVTEADGLAVARASELVYGLVRNLVSGVFTVPDNDLFRMVHAVWHTEKIKIEPSAAAGFPGPHLIALDEAASYINRVGLQTHMKDATHIVWTTGGLFVPAEEFSGFLKRGAESATHLSGDE